MVWICKLYFTFWKTLIASINKYRGKKKKKTDVEGKCHDPFAPCKEIRIPESMKFLLVESGILGFGIQNTAVGIRNPTEDWNPESRFHWQRLYSSTWNPESTAWNPESKTVLDSLTWVKSSPNVFQLPRRRISRRWTCDSFTSLLRAN